MVVRNDESIVNDLLTMAPTNGVQPTFGQNADFSGVSVASASAETSLQNFDPETDGFSLKARIDKVVAKEESQLIKSALTKTNWNRRKASQLLAISYRSLLYKIKEYALNEIK